MAEYLEAAALLIANNNSLSSSRKIFLSLMMLILPDDIAQGAFDHMNFTLYYTRYGLLLFCPTSSISGINIYALFRQVRERV
jgi:hypothetical protein